MSLIDRSVGLAIAGLSVIRQNQRLVIVVIVVFVLPLIFVWTNQQFFNVAYDNISTTEKERVGTLHDALSRLLVVDGALTRASSTFAYFASEDEDITKMRLVTVDQESVTIVAALEPDLIGQSERDSDIYRALPLNTNDTSHIFITSIDGERTWQVFRRIMIEDRPHILFTEHKYGRIDSVMLSRQQYAYLVLTFIFLFMIWLAYWVNRQTDFEAKYRKVVAQLKERDRFTHMVAHELRSPLTAIRGYASFLGESSSLTTEELRYTENIRVSTERLVTLVSDFLEVARLQSGKLSVKPVPVDIRQILERAAAEMQATAKEKDLTVRYDTPVSPINYEIDPDRLTQVLHNLISNAIKYTNEGGVELDASKEREQLTITVSDTGTGISASDQQKLFTPFTRVGDADRSNITGSGLGMWITQQLVTELGGTIGVESLKGVGTRIVITF